MNGSDKSDANRVGGERQAVASPPSISLPKGGGAIRGMGEKFAANPVTGTGSMTVPIATSPGRSGFGPQLSLSYDSGAGNGPYGFGWSLSLPSITRKTDKGLPKYEDADGSDIFIFSGAEDLVPVFKTNSITGEFVKDAKGNFVYDEFPRDGYLVRRYRPRIEGPFARIERWTRQSDGDVYWRSISKDNITTFYGKTEESRVADPEDPSRIFSWLICQSYDDKGNAIVYKYKEENSDGIDLAQVHEKNRTSSSRSANRYPKNILYSNRAPNRDVHWNATDPAQLPESTWMFEVVFDYENGHYREQGPDADERIFAEATIDIPPNSSWPARQDPFSSYRAAFEVRTYRLCRRVLMFHHFPAELGAADYLVRSTEFTYKRSSIASFITQVTQSGYVRQAGGSYLKKSLPPLSFEYSKAEINDEIETVDAESLKNLPVGANGFEYQWLDLDGEGLQCVLAEQQGGWHYKRNVSPISTVSENGKEKVVARFEPLIEVTTQPSAAEVGTARHQFLDLAGDGSLDVVQLERPVSGFFERTEDERWESFVPFESAPNVRWNDPNLRFIDLTGDGHADILITEDEALTWYPSLAEEGFGTAIRIPTPRDEEKAPAVVFADAAQTIFAADLSGDGLTDIVRIRNGEVCYWPNLGHGHFGAKVTMDNAPWFDTPDQFDPKRIRLADIDGSGTTDIIHLERHRAAVYRNECGNRWSPAEYLTSFPCLDDLSSVVVVDLLGNGTACLVWSSPLPGNGQRQMRYISLMEDKPHLLVGVKNNLGAETVVQYAPSTKFYLQDRLDGKPWITRLPFPVHVVERVETCDLISRNRFVTRYVYHHGYFDGEEREFGGFGMVEQWDTEEIGALKAGGTLLDASNVDESSYVPPAYTKTWFHNGAYIEGERISRHFEEEYYNEGDESEGVSELTDEQLKAMLLPDTRLPLTLKQRHGSSIPWELTAEEIREACRALKGAVLRREIYSRDGTDDEDRPFSAMEQNYTIELLQPQGVNKHTVFFTHPRESIDFHYERKLVRLSGKTIADPRVTHTMTLEVDGYGNVMKSVAIGYGRRLGVSPLQGQDKNKQEQIHVTYTENQPTNAIEEPDAYRAPLACELCTYELIELPSLVPASNQSEITNLFRFAEMLSKTRSASDGQHDLTYENSEAVGALPNQTYRRLIEEVRTLYRGDNLTGLLPLGALQSLAVPGESYKLAFTPGLLAQVFQRNGQALLASPAAIVGGQGADEGGYVDLNGSGHWWVPSGRMFFDVEADVTNPSLTAPSELAEARAHFFLPRKFIDAFNQTATIEYDPPHDLLVTKTEDALQNAVEAANNYRTLQPWLVTDPNGNRSEVEFDGLGMVIATVVKGKINQNFGDLLEDFEPDPAPKALQEFVADPAGQAASLLGKTTSRLVYDLDRFMRCGQPPFTSSLARETHFHDPGGAQTRIQISFSYSDGFGREIQKKIQAEGGDAPKREAPVQLPSRDIGPGDLVRDAQGNLVQANTPRRWVGTGRTVFNNKGNPVRQYEHFFSSTHLYEEERDMSDTGVSPILFYDPAERVVATLHPNHSWEKIVFNPWEQATYDVNDTVLNADDFTDPKSDKDVKQFFSRLSDADYLPTWYEQRIALPANDPDRVAADKAAIHRQTPTVAHLDTLGRTFLTIGGCPGFC
jgi:Salmonella virulence plasmid 65kDa B protein/Insecticide toxin TcdB middle/C-terminal region/Insecticide toxin TcdB middle/N-terminal region